MACSRPRITKSLASLTAATVERWHDGPESADGAVPRWDPQPTRSWGRLGQRRQFRSGKNLCSEFEHRDISGRPPDRAERHEHANGRGLSGRDGCCTSPSSRLAWDRPRASSRQPHNPDGSHNEWPASRSGDCFRPSTRLADVTPRRAEERKGQRVSTQPWPL